MLSAALFYFCQCEVWLRLESIGRRMTIHELYLSHPYLSCSYPRPYHGFATAVCCRIHAGGQSYMEGVVWYRLHGAKPSRRIRVQPVQCRENDSVSPITTLTSTAEKSSCSESTTGQRRSPEETETLRMPCYPYPAQDTLGTPEHIAAAVVAPDG